MLRRLRDQALVLQRRDLGESDRLLVLLGREQGLFSAVAPAGRASRRRFGGCLELFSHIDVDVVDKGKGGLWRLQEASLLDAHPGIRSDLISIAHAGYLSELVSAMTREGEEVLRTYELLKNALGRLNNGPLSTMDLRFFELDLLNLAGLSPNLSGCQSCGQTEAENWSFDFDQSSLICCNCLGGPRSEPLEPRTLEILRAVQSGHVEKDYDNKHMNAIRAIMARLIDNHVGRPLKAREFLRQMAAQSRS